VRFLALDTRASLALALCCFLGLSAAVMVPRMDDKPPEHDAELYVSYAYSLLQYGTFGPARGGKETRPGNQVPPGYPLFLAGLMAVDPAFKDATACFLAREKDCDLRFGNARYVQMALGLAGILAVWLAARRITGRTGAAHLAALAYIGGVDALETPARFFHTENIAIPLVAWIGYCLLRGMKDRHMGWMVAAGVLFGALALTRPAFAYVGVVTALVVAVSAWWTPGRRARVLALALAFGVAFAAVQTPWTLRNQALADDPAFAVQVGGFVLALRAAYNQMTPGEYMAAFVYWLPDFGDSLAERLFPDDAARLDPDNPDGFRLSAAREWDRAKKANLLAEKRAEVIARLRDEPLRHLAATLPIAVRGMFPDKVSLVSVPVLLILVWLHLRRGKPELFWFALPALLSLAFHSLLTHNLQRYGMPLIPASALALGIALAAAVERLAAALWARSGLVERS